MNFQIRTFFGHVDNKDLNGLHCEGEEEKEREGAAVAALNGCPFQPERIAMGGLQTAKQGWQSQFAIPSSL